MKEPEVDQPGESALETLDDIRCWRLLKAGTVGRLGFDDDDGPTVVPVNYMLDGHTIILRTEPASSLARLAGGAEIAFEVDCIDTFSKVGESVVVRGCIAAVTDDAVLRALQRRPLVPWAPGPMDCWMRISPALVTGRVVRQQTLEAGGRRLPYMPPD